MWRASQLITTFDLSEGNNVPLMLVYRAPHGESLFVLVTLQ